MLFYLHIKVNIINMRHYIQDLGKKREIQNIHITTSNMWLHNPYILIKQNAKGIKLEAFSGTN